MHQRGSLIEQALERELSGELEAALALYSEAAHSRESTDADRVNAWFRLGVVQEKLGLTGDAVRSWESGASEGGNADLSRRCAFHAACALAANGDSAAATRWLRDMLPGDGDPSARAVRWKLLAVEPGGGELPPCADGPLEALLAIEAGFALEVAGDVHRATQAYWRALESNALDDASRLNAELRLRHASQRLALRAGSAIDVVDFDALHAETWHALQTGDLVAAERLALAMPGAEAHTAARIGHMLVTTAFALESAGETSRARNVYETAVRDEGLPAAERTNAAYRLGMLLGEADRAFAIDHLRLAIGSPDDAVHSAAALHLAHFLIESAEWDEALAVCESHRIQDASIRDLLAVRGVQCRAQLDRLPDQPELPNPTAAHAGAWMDAALACESHDSYPVARLLYERLLGAEGLPGDIRANVQFRIGFVLDRMMLWNEAEAYLAAAARSADAWPATRVHARYRLGSIYYLLDRYESAEAEFDKLRTDADADPPVRADAQLKHGMCLFRLNRIDDAARDFRTCRAIGGEIEVKAELMLAEIAELRRDFATARDSYNRVIQHPQANPLTKSSSFQRLRALPRK